MREPGADRIVPLPQVGRIFRAIRRARFGDVSPGGRARFDALARYLQDVSSDDSVDAGLDDSVAWVVRRTVFEVRQPPRFREMLELSTFCSGLGSRWAERRVSMVGEHGASVESATVWVRIDVDTGKPLLLGDRFHELYDEAAQGREVTARLQLAARPPDAAATRMPWPLRFADFDLLAHVNNAASWVMVEEALARRHDLVAPYRAELEYRGPIERDDDIDVVTHDEDGALELWAVRAGTDEGTDAFVIARVSPLID